MESKLIKSNPLVGYLKGIISRVSHTCFNFSANRATSSNMLLTRKTLPARAFSLHISRAKSSSMYTGKLYVPQLLKKDFCYKYHLLLWISRLFARLAVRFFPRTEKDTWYNRGFYFLFRAAWQVLGLTPSKIQRIGFPPQLVLSNYRRIVPTRSGYIGLALATRNPGTRLQCSRVGKCC